ncbi:MAG: response regulator transcription factor [Elusimicrobia bacterium]|nr:response regulator transcription factor [Elusimicrobiota bacterium]
MARLLIIEDSGDLQQLLSLAFHREGYEVYYAFNGKEGHDKILAVQPDVILLDLMLPIMNGVEIIKLVTANAAIRDIPIVVMTAHGDKADMLESSVRAQGVREYVRKPFELAQIKSIVRRLLAQYPRRAAPAAQVAKGKVRLDVKLRALWIDDRSAGTLSPTPAEVLRVLLAASGPVGREKLLREVWGAEGSVAALEKTIQRLREALGPEESKRLQTTAEGYELVG